MKKNFKYDLKTIYTKANEIILKIKTEKMTNKQINFLIEDLLEISKELVINKCKKFIINYTLTEVTIDELYTIATSIPLIKAIEYFDFNKGNNFMPMWEMFIKRAFINHLKEINTEKKKFFRNNCYSFNATLDEKGTTILDYIGINDFSDELCESLILLELIKKFENEDKYGSIIKYFFIDTQEIRIKAFKKILGSNTYGAKERKKVQRVKERFAKFLIMNGINYYS